MSKDKEDEFPLLLERILRVAAAYEAGDLLDFVILRDSGERKGYWAGHGNLEGKLEVSIRCNDLFFWATSESVAIESNEDVDLLEECLKIDDIEGGKIYACRKRKMRPQNCILERMEDHVKPYLEACGPPRTDEECG